MPDTDWQNLVLAELDANRVPAGAPPAPDGLTPIEFGPPPRPEPEPEPEPAPGWSPEAPGMPEAPHGDTPAAGFPEPGAGPPPPGMPEEQEEQHLIPGMGGSEGPEPYGAQSYVPEGEQPEPPPEPDPVPDSGHQSYGYGPAFGPGDEQAYDAQIGYMPQPYTPPPGYAPPPVNGDHPMGDQGPYGPPPMPYGQPDAENPYGPPPMPPPGPPPQQWPPGDQQAYGSGPYGPAPGSSPQGGPAYPPAPPSPYAPPGHQWPSGEQPPYPQAPSGEQAAYPPGPPSPYAPQPGQGYGPPSGYGPPAEQGPYGPPSPYGTPGQQWPSGAQPPYQQAPYPQSPYPQAPSGQQPAYPSGEQPPYPQGPYGPYGEQPGYPSGQQPQWPSGQQAPYPQAPSGEQQPYPQAPPGQQWPSGEQAAYPSGEQAPYQDNPYGRPAFDRQPPPPPYGTGPEQAPPGGGFPSPDSVRGYPQSPYGDHGMQVPPPAYGGAPGSNVPPPPYGPPQGYDPQQAPYGRESGQAPPMPYPQPQPGYGTPPGMGAGAPPPEALAKNVAHGDPIGRRMRRMVGGGAAKEMGRLAEQIRQPVPSPRRIAISSIRGGSGKTTIASLVSTVLAHYREDPVLVIDADPDLGSLALRLGVAPQRTLAELAEAPPPQTFEELVPYLVQHPSGLWVLTGTRRDQTSHQLSQAQYDAALEAASRFFAITVIDCGAGLLNELSFSVLDSANALSLVTGGTVDGALSANGALDWLSTNNHAQLIQRTLVTLVTHAPHQATDLGQARSMLQAHGCGVIELPYDRQLAAGTVLDPSRLAESTRITAMRIAATLLGSALH